MQRGDKVRVRSDRPFEGGMEGVITEPAKNGDHWKVRITHDPTSKREGFLMTYLESSLELMDPETPWFHDEIFVDNMLDKLVDALEQNAAALNRHSDLLASIFGK